MSPSKLLTFLFISFLSIPALAHPGHGSETVDPNGAFHYISTLNHLIPLLTIIGIILFAIIKKRKESKRAFGK